MKKLMVIAIVGIMVMGLAAMANAGATDPAAWAIYLKAADQNGASYLATQDYFGVAGTAEATTSAGLGTGSAQVALASFDSGAGTYGNGMTKILKPSGTTGNVFNLKLWGMDACQATAFKLTGWNPTGTYDLPDTMQSHLKVVSVPAGVTLTDTVSGITYTTEQLNAGRVEYLFTGNVNSTSAAPQMQWVFNFTTMPKSGTAIQLQLVPEPGSMLAMLSGLVGLVGYGIRRRK